MKKKAEGMSLRETFAIHRRAARDMRRIAPGCFTPFILCAVVEAASPYAVIWLSARLVDELSTLRRPEILAKWVLWIVAVSAAAELLKAVLERWKNVRSELLDRQKEVLYTEKFLRMDYADCDRQETRDLFSQIRQNADWSGWGFAHLKLYYTQAVQGITGILGAAALTVSLFTRQVPTSAGKLTALNHPLFRGKALIRKAAASACHLLHSGPGEGGQNSRGGGGVADAHLPNANGLDSLLLGLARQLQTHSHGIQYLLAGKGRFFGQIAGGTANLPVQDSRAPHFGVDSHIRHHHRISKVPGQGGHAGNMPGHVHRLTQGHGFR